jgi:uncharacterized protein YigA (DUF484 family)
MTTRDARGALAAMESEEETIAAYLQHHPDFFERHQALLARLKVPHVRGGSVVSLVERQIAVLRDKLGMQDRKLAEMARAARATEAMADRLHRLTRRLMRARSRAAALLQVEASLREDFDAPHSMLILIGDYPDLAPSRFLRTLRANDTYLKSFETLFASGKPRCGQLRDSQREFLFGADAKDVASAAQVPLGSKGALGLLAVGSPDRDRFHPGMSTEFLARMADLIADALTATA